MGITIEAGGASRSDDRLIGPDSLGLQRFPQLRPGRGEAAALGSSEVVLFLHNRYRTTGGEERVVDDLLWLVRERLGEPAELLTRSSEELGRGRAALGLLRGGLDPDEVASRRARARALA